MHYYKRNIGDYAKKAARLSMLQHGAYTLLIDSCYDREKFPTLDEALDWTWASSKEEVEAVEFVLRRFFVLEDGVYVQKRIEEEIKAYHQMAETNARIAKEREERRRNGGKSKTGRARTVNDSSTEGEQPVNEPPPNQEPLTTNQEPRTNGNGRMKRPTLEELIFEFEGRIANPEVEAKKFLNHYESNGWKVGKNPMKSWKHAVTNWITRSNENATGQSSTQGHKSASEIADDAAIRALQRAEAQQH